MGSLQGAQPRPAPQGRAPTSATRIHFSRSRARWEARSPTSPRQEATTALATRLNWATVARTLGQAPSWPFLSRCDHREPRHSWGARRRKSSCGREGGARRGWGGGRPAVPPPTGSLGLGSPSSVFWHFDSPEIQRGAVAQDDAQGYGMGLQHRESCWMRQGGGPAQPSCCCFQPWSAGSLEGTAPLGRPASATTS